MFFEQVLVALHEAGVGFVVVGGTAVVDAGRLVLPIAAVEDLIRMKEAAAREQDLADADALRRLLEDRG